MLEKVREDGAGDSHHPGAAGDSRGVAVFGTAPTSNQEIAGILLFGFGVLTMAVMYIAVTFEGLWKEHLEAQAAIAAVS